MGSRQRLTEELIEIQQVHPDDIEKCANAVEGLKSAGDEFTDLLFEWDSMGANRDMVVDKLRLQLRKLSIHVDNIAISRGR